MNSSFDTWKSWRFWQRTALTAVLLLLLGLSVGAGTGRAAVDPRVNLWVLLISNGTTNPEALAVQMDRQGVPYTKITVGDPARPTIDPGYLFDTATQTARFQAVVLPDQAGGGLSTEELTALATYERTYGVRQVNAQDWPGPAVGTTWPSSSEYQLLDGGTVTVEPAARSGSFAYLRDTLPIDDFDPNGNEIVGTFAQPATDLPVGATFTTLLTASATGGSGVLAGVYAHDGREELTITAGFNEHMQVFQMIAPGIVDWMTRGIHLGYQRQYFDVQVDDIFLADSRWSVEGDCTPGDNCVDPKVTTTDIRMLPADVDRLVAWQNAHDFTFDMVFNSGGIALFEQDHPGKTDQLAPAFLAVQDRFPWINHTLEHTYLGCIQIAPLTQTEQWHCATTPEEIDPANPRRQDPTVTHEESGGTYWAAQAYITAQVRDNYVWAQQHGLTDFDPTELVTGEHSGLASRPQMETDNPFLGQALADAGIAYTASDASREKDPRAAGPATITVPRYPMNIFYNAGTFQDEVDEYNWIYAPAGSPGGGNCQAIPDVTTCMATSLPAAKPEAEASFHGYIKPIEIRNALGKVLTNDPRPFYAHQSNLAEDGILYPVVEGVLAQYRATYAPSAPVVQLDLKGQSEALTRMTAWRAASGGVDAYLDGSGIHVPSGSTAVPLTVPTGTTGVSLEPYGGALSGWLTGGGTAIPPTEMGGYIGTGPTAPGTPTIGTAEAGDASATVTWTAPTDTGNSAISGYEIKVYQGSGTTSLRSIPVDGPAATSHTVTGLDNGTPYEFTVAARNGEGTGAESARTAAVTPLPPLPGAPALGEVTAGNASATASWAAPTKGGPVDGYVVRAFPAGSGTPVTATVDASTTSTVLGGLTNGTTYTVEVAATSFGRTGTPSQRSGDLTPVGRPGRLGAPSVTAGNGQVVVSWDAPADTGGAAITEYVLTTYQGDTAVDTRSVTGTTTTVTGLANGTAYAFTVTARNGQGPGLESERSAAATPLGTPGAPSITAVTAGDGQVAVVWTAPASDGGAAVTGYRVIAYQGGTAVGAPVTVDPSTLTATVDELTNGTAYTFTVEAGNAHGFGPASDRSASATPQAPMPGAPSITSVTPGDGLVTVVWTAPASDGGAAVTGYRVTVYRGDAPVVSQTVGGAVLTATLDRLVNGTTHTVEVVAVNAAGDGPAVRSASVTPQAPATVPGPPSITSVTPGTGQVTIAWSAPASDGGAAISGYRVIAYQGDTAVGTPVTVGGDARTATVTGLATGVTYTFTVVAINELGDGAASAPSEPVTLTAPLTAPGAPEIISVTVGSGRVTVAWTAPADTGGSPITGYEVITYQGTTAVGDPVAVDGDARTATVSGLTNGTAYSFAVVARNDHGAGPPSARSATVTPLGTPGAPTVGTATAGNRSATVTWTPPGDTGGSPLTGFVVRAFPKGAGAPSVTTTVGASATSAAVTGLVNGTTYTFEVLATNAAGTGAPSARSNEVTPAAPRVPGAPGGLTAGARNASALLTWVAPADTGGSPITGYVISVYRGTGTAVQKTVTVSAAATTATVTGLTNGTAYTFTVAAKNAVGTGTASTRSNSVTPGTVPGKPSIGSAKAGEASAVVRWSAPSTGGSAITGYVISVYRGTSTTAAWTVSVPEGTQATITGLTNGTSYRFSVAAVNAFGTGATSARSNAVTPRTSPVAPTIGTARAGTRSATVTWAGPRDNGGAAISGYVVRAYQGTRLVKTVTVARNATRTTVSGLTRGVTYVFNVSARNAAGTGAPSAWSNRITAR